ncbi:MAG TPA: tetratricopeptide repeat protein [Tenuifilaceae bacterium]|nr:tetratricopeptide repeat protein [Tenuifilaceae bacterium]HPN20503.1 tetratricopeptide repeat protein [Tenuifilaceae bacterium]
MIKRLLLSVYFISLCFLGIAQTKSLSSTQQKEVQDNINQAKELEASGDFNLAISIYTKTATTYWVAGNTTEAKTLFQKAINLSQSIGNNNALKILYTNIGMIDVDQENYSDAISYFEKCLVINRQQNRKPEIASTLINIANAYNDSEQPKQALKPAEEANTIAKEINDPKLLRNTYSLLSEIYDALGDSNKSAEYFSLYTAFSRKIQRDEVQKKEAQAKELVNQAQNELSEIKNQKELTEQELQAKQQALETVSDSLAKVEQISQEQQMEINLLNKEKQLQEVTIKNQRLVRNIFIVIILAVLGIAVMITRYYLQKKKSNEKLEKQNREIAAQRDLIEAKSNELLVAMQQIEKQNRDITSSINYAQRIQEALLPTYDMLIPTINDAFILFHPREIVSGDFYWFSGYTGSKSIKTSSNRHFIQLPNKLENESGFLIAAVDCTGHGVPGAFMSMIGLNLLDTLARSGITSPNEMLNEMHRYVRYLLKQENNDSRDGMDMALCNITNNGQTIEFAGAKNPLYYIANGELFQIKGDPVPIGGLQKEEKREFTLHTINIDSPTSFYIFSDGFIDQFGGADGQKFSSKRFKELLFKIHDLPMLQQQEILETTLEEWRGEEYQPIDDVLIVGFRLSGKPIQI